MYSTPKYKAKEVKVRTKAEQIRDKVSTQKTKWESIKSKQKNQLFWFGIIFERLYIYLQKKAWTQHQKKLAYFGYYLFFL